MQRLRIFLIWKHPLLRDTVHAILEQAGLALSGEFAGEADLEQLRQLRPDVLLVEDDGHLVQRLLPLLSEMGGVRLIRISLEDNRLHLYQHLERTLTHQSDLIEALQSVVRLDKGGRPISLRKETRMAGETPWFRQPKKVLPLVVVAILLLVAGVFGLQRTQAAPPQPIAFNHSVHVNLGVQCLYCHSGALRGQTAGLPTISKCMGCHQQIDPGDNPGKQALMEYAQSGQPVEWVPVAMMPDFVYFSHRPHVNAGLNCETCHGDVSKMTVAEPQKDMNMGWCLACHKGLAPEHFVKLSDCATCHK